MPDDPHNLRKEAARLRRMANIRTVGGHEADAHLFALAHRFEKRASALEVREPMKANEPARR